MDEHDETELTVDLFSFGAVATQPPSVDPAALRRAMIYGRKARERFTRPFWNVEAALRAGWEKRGETTEWDWVRAAVRVGYEQGADEV